MLRMTAQHSPLFLCKVVELVKPVLSLGLLDHVGWPLLSVTATQ